MNSFALCLRELLSSLKIKHAVLAQYVQYDVSYISKWCGGKALPSRQTAPAIISAIVDCVLSLPPEELAGRLGLGLEAVAPSLLRPQLEGQLSKAFEEALAQREEQPQTLFVAQEDLVHALSRLREGEGPWLLLADLLGMEHESRLLLARIKNGHFISTNAQCRRQLQCLIDLDSMENPIYDCIFLIHMLTSYSLADFRLYHSPAAKGRLLAVEDGGQSLSTFVLEGREALALTQSRDPVQAHSLYQRLSALCTQENLLFQESDMERMLQTNQYTRSLLSSRLRWLVGHITEQFLPQELLRQLAAQEEPDLAEQILRADALRRSVFQSAQLDILLYDSALANLLLDGELDFFNRPRHLDEGQRLQVLRYLLSLSERPNIHLRLIHEGVSSDFRFITNPCLFLSEAFGYLRLENERYEHNLLLVRDKAMMERFGQCFEAIWSQRPDVVAAEPQQVLEEIRRFMAPLEAGYSER